MLCREAPTPMQQFEQQAELLEHLFQQPPPGSEQGKLPGLLRKLPPVGISLTIHF